MKLDTPNDGGVYTTDYTLVILWVHDTSDVLKLNILTGLFFLDYL